MIKPRINQLHRDYEAAKDIGQGAMRLNVGTKFVTAKKRIPAKEGIALALEIKIFRQPSDFITLLLHRFREERLLASTLFVAEIAGDELVPHR